YNDKLIVCFFNLHDLPQLVHLTISEPQFASEVLHQFEWLCYHHILETDMVVVQDLDTQIINMGNLEAPERMLNVSVVLFFLVW
ncbi:hypothetical protein ACJX0J_024981, partial [Zea mays]